MPAEIRLARGDIALVSECDLARVSSFHWHLDTHGYARRIVHRTNVYLHRWVIGAPQGAIVDHINRVPLDCRRENLRIVTSSQNSQNRSAMRGKKYTRLKGVTWNRSCRRWQVHCAGSYIGVFADELEAARAYDAAARDAFGEFAATNFLPDGSVNASTFPQEIQS